MCMWYFWFLTNKFAIKANKFIEVFKQTLSLWSVVCRILVKNELNPFKNVAGITPSHNVKCNIRLAPYFEHLNMVMGINMLLFFKTKTNTCLLSMAFTVN